jgi:hypothetical protein
MPFCGESTVFVTNDTPRQLASRFVGLAKPNADGSLTPRPCRGIARETSDTDYLQRSKKRAGSRASRKYSVSPAVWSLHMRHLLDQIQ